MTMILQLLIAVVAVGLSVATPATVPPYKEYVQAMEEAAVTLAKNVLSMKGHMPLLDDARRHYAEIVHVVNYHGKQRSGCFNGDYYEEYYPYLNISAPEAIKNPERVITEIKNPQDKVDKIIVELKELINACVQTSDVCNELIDNTVKENPDKFSYPAIVLIGTGEAAKDLNELNEKFEEVSKNLKAHQYVSTSPEDLEHIVNSVAQVYRSLKSYPREC